MEQRHKENGTNLIIHSLLPYSNEKFDGICIKCESDIGFGEYNIYREVGADQWYAHSECMDSNEDKAFLKELLLLVTDSVIVKD